MKIDDVLSLQKFSADGPLKTDLVESERFKVALVSLETSQEIPPHPEPYAVFFMVLEGEGVFTTGEGSFELQPGSGIFIESGGIRGIKCLDRLTILAVHDRD